MGLRPLFWFIFTTLGVILIFHNARAGEGVGMTAAGSNQDCEKIVAEAHSRSLKNAEVPPLCGSCPRLVYTSYTEAHSRIHFAHPIAPDSVINYQTSSYEQKISFRRRIAEFARQTQSTSFFPPGVSARDVVENIVPGPEWRERRPDFATRAVEGPVSIKGKKYRIRIVFPNSAVRKNQIISIIPICGPDVVRILSYQAIVHSPVSEQPAFIAGCP